MMKALLFLASLLFFLVPSTNAWAQDPCQMPPGGRRPAHNWRLMTLVGSPPQYAYWDQDRDEMGDRIYVRIADGAAAGLRNDQMKIVLIAVPWVTWKKEVSAWGCSGKIQTISTSGYDHGPHEMTIARGAGSSRIDTIVLSKATFVFDWMTDMYHFDPAYFWRIYGGKIVTVEWYGDIGGIPEDCSYDYPSWCIPVGSDPDAGVFFDTDRKAEPAIWHPATGEWLVDPPSPPPAHQWGAADDVPVPGDYDGDGRPDITVWRRSTREWFIIDSAAGLARPAIQWGGGADAADVAVPADYNRDGKTDIAIWRPSTGEWWIRDFAPVVWGGGADIGDIPVPADYDGDGITDIAIWRPSTGQWWIRYTAGLPPMAGTLGSDIDVPVPGEYSGLGKTEIAVWRPSTGEWFIPGRPTVVWGGSGDVPVPGDYDGDGRTDLAYWRPWTGEWHILNSSSGTEQVRVLGTKGDLPVRSGLGSKILLPPQALLRVTRNGSGTVSTADGMNCGTQCSKPYAPGTRVTLTATPAAGSQFSGWTGGGCTGTGPCEVAVTVNTPITASFCVAPCLTLSYNGKIKDRVGQGNKALAPDSQLDGVFTLRSTAVGGVRTVTSLELRAPNYVWDTVGSTASWAIGVANTLDGGLLNNADASVNFTLAAGAAVTLFVADPGVVIPPVTLILTVRFSDGSTATVSVPI
ncbi:MAG TPA: FG-GAP-like repeat-containing protein [Methylomirabilota bacterium]|jgi:hypothetical protein